MSEVFETFDLHITINPDSLTNPSMIEKPWKIQAMNNFQGSPHLIVSRQYISEDIFSRGPLYAIEAQSQELVRKGVTVYRKKIEAQFDASALADLPLLMRLLPADYIVEIHYKLAQPLGSAVTQDQIIELNRKKLALSHNTKSGQAIISVRFADWKAYLAGRATDELPWFIEKEESEGVLRDTNPDLDSFWPIRTIDDLPLILSALPEWLYSKED